MSGAVDKPASKKKKGKRARRAAQPKGIQAILARGRAGAKEVEKGKFRLDWKRALDKIKRFQLTDPHRYVLEVVQAAISGGATAIDVEADSDDVILSFDGRGYSAEELERLFDYLFTQDVELAPLKQLALGVNAALGMEPKFVTVESGSSRIRLTEHLDLEVETIDPPVDGTRVQVRDRVSWAVLVDAFRSQTAELALLQSECAHAPIPIRVHGEDVRAETDPTGHAAVVVPFEEGGYRGVVYLPLQRSETSTIDICMNGVRIVQRKSQDRQWRHHIGVHAWVDAPTFSRNASHSDVHEDAIFGQAMTHVSVAIREALRKFAEQVVVKRKDHGVGVLGHLHNACVELLDPGSDEPLSEVQNALLDAPDMVELATTLPGLSSLRPFWDKHVAGESLKYATKRDDLPGRYLPEGLIVVRARDARLLRAIFDTEIENADAELAAIALGQMNRRRREENPMDPILADRQVLVKVPVQDAKTKLHGELGIPAPGVVDQLGMFAEQDAARSGGKLVVTCLRERVPLATIRMSNRLLEGVAIVDSPKLEPTESWDGVQRTPTLKAVRKVLDRHTLPLLRELRFAFPELPPPASMIELEHFSTEESVAGTMAIRAGWPTDTLTTLARRHVDHILAHHKRISVTEAEWLYDWRIWHGLDGLPHTLKELVADAANVRSVVAYPWGVGAPGSLRVLNLTELQAQALRRYLKGTLVSGELGVEKHRAEITRRAETEGTRRRNMAAAELRRQPARLDATRYAAVVDVELAGGSGQVGLPRFPNTPSLRYLVGELPLIDHTFETCLPVHAVVTASSIQANDTFDDLANPKIAKKVIAAVEKAYPRLLEAYAGTTDMRSMEGRALLWSWLASLGRPPKSDPMTRLPEAVRHAPLVATVDRGYLSLAQVYEDAKAHKGGARVTKMQAFRQLSERPILICNDREREILVKVLAIQIRGYTRELEREQDVLKRLDAPRRAAVLVDTAMSAPISREDITGQVSILQTLVTAPGDERIRSLDVLREGVFIERTSLTPHGAPLAAVIDCPRLVPTPRWTSVARDGVWNEVQEAVEEASHRLLHLACESLSADSISGLRRLAVAIALRAAAVRRFAENPELEVLENDELAEALVQAPMWTSAGGDHQWVSLEQLREQRAATGAIWVVDGRQGHVAPGRVIINGATEGQELATIFGKKYVKDGERVLARDDEAYRRRLSAPTLTPGLGPHQAMGIVSVEYANEEVGFTVTGQLGLRNPYADGKPGIQVRIGLDGRLLCERWVEHGLRAVAHLDCTGVRPNRDWNGLGDAFQTRTIDRLVRDATLRALDAMIANTPLASFGGDRLHACFDGLQLARVNPNAPSGLHKRLTSLPLWRTVEGQTITGDEIAARGKAGPILVVSDTSPTGSPSDGRFILHASSVAIGALQYMGVSWERHDHDWSEELAGQARRRSAARVSPAVSDDAIGQMYFQRGQTSGLVALRRPRAGALDDSADSPSLVTLHIDRRYVAKREPSWHPAIEAWVNDDRLTPTRSFQDVVSDEVLAEVMETVRDHIPEVLVRATDAIDGARVEQPLRLRLSGYVLARPEALSAPDAGAQAEALLRAKIWRCLTPDGLRMRSTVDLQESHGAGHLAFADAVVYASAAPAGWSVVYLTEPEMSGFRAVFDGVPDHSERLSKLAHHRKFLSRSKVGAVDLGSVRKDGSILWTRALTDDGWEGELAIMAERGSIMTTHIFVEHRPLTTHEIVAPVRAVAAAQFLPLQANESFDDIEQNAASKRFVRELREEVWEALIEMAGKLDDMRSYNRDRARVILLDAIARRRTQKNKSDPVLKALEAAPLLADYAGRMWSIDGLRQTVKGKVRAISVANAKRGDPLDEGVVLVLDDQLWPAVNEVIQIKSWNERFLQQVEARERMERAPTKHRFSRRKTLVLEEVRKGEAIHGELGLARDPEDGGVALFHRGRVVEVYGPAKMRGLVGSLHGDWKVNREFTRASLNRDQSRDLYELYVERLAAAAALAGEQKKGRGRTWEALAAYAIRYLQHSMARVSGNRQERLDRVLTRAKELDPSVRKALDARIVRTNDGDWIDVPTLVAGDDPMIVVCDSRVRRVPKTDAILVENTEGLAEVLTGLLGSARVLAYETWRDKLRNKELAAKKKRKAKELTKERRHERLASKLRSLLREAVGKGGGGLGLKAISKLQCRAIPDTDDLVQVHGPVVVNTEHRVWIEALEAPLGARALFHLAAAVLTELSWGDDSLLRTSKLSGEESLLHLLTRLAAHASNR